MQTFNNWKDFTDFVYTQIGHKLFSGVGISYRKNRDCILRSVDNTEYYFDRLKKPDICYYTLFGREGDQSKDEKRFNVPLLKKSKRIFLYRVSRGKYIWYGEYILQKSLYKKQHPDINGNMRKIYLAKLYKI
jgi:hypothetical protein